MAESGPLRVVHVVCTEQFAGVERYVVSAARGLTERGCDVRIIGGHPVRIEQELDGSGVHWGPGGTVGAAVRALARHHDADIIHVHMTKAELAATLAHPLVRAPIVSTRHFAQPRGSSAPARAVGRVLTRAMSAQLAISDFVARTTEGPSIVVRPGVPSRPEGHWPRQPYVLVAQRLEVEKRTDLALRLWARTGLAGAGWRLRIAGDGTLRGELTALAEQLGIAGSCEFLGARGDISELMSAAGAFLATRPDEPFGLSVVEAMAAGTPVVAARGGGHDETVGLAGNAALFDVGDLDAAATLLTDVAGDADRGQRYGDELRTLQQAHFTVGRQVEQTLQIYRSLVTGRRG